jgi:hypothetical protein
MARAHNQGFAHTSKGPKRHAQVAAISTPTPTPPPSFDATYYSMLSTNGRITAITKGIDYRANTYQYDGGASTSDGMDHTLRFSGRRERVRIQVNNTEADKTAADTGGQRRCEMDAEYLLPNDTVLWGAMSVILEPWVEPASVAEATGYIIYQTHLGGGGSPSFAIRINPAGQLWVTRAGPPPDDNSNVTLYTGDIDFDTVHDFVWRQTINPTAGSVELWLNGAKIVDVSGVPVGQAGNLGYPKWGIYAAGGLGSNAGAQVAAQFANVVDTKPSIDLTSRISAPPAWPQDLREDALAPVIAAQAASTSGGTNLTSWVPTLASHAAGDGLVVIVSIDATDAATPANNPGWTRLIQTAGADHQDIWYYGSGGVLAPAPSGSVTPPTIAMTNEQATAVALTVRLPEGASGDMVLAVAGASGNASVVNPPALTLASTKPTLWLACGGPSGNAGTVIAYPPGYVSGIEATALTTAGVCTQVAHWRNTADFENPSSFQLGFSRDWVAHTLAVSLDAAP